MYNNYNYGYVLIPQLNWGRIIINYDKEPRVAPKITAVDNVLTLYENWELNSILKTLLSENKTSNEMVFSGFMPTPVTNQI